VHDAGARRFIAVSPRRIETMKLKTIAGLFAALLFAFAAVACNNSSATPTPAAESPAAAAESPAG
jgi:hypothetical protein